MTQYLRTLLVGALALGLCQLMACSSDDPPPLSIEEQQRQKLVKRWTIASVTLNNVAQSEYTGLELVLTGSASGPFSYQANNRPTLSPWPESGTWVFGDDPVSQLVRDPASTRELEMVYIVSDTQLQLSFTFSGNGFANRAHSVQGQWVFAFTAP
ncbi:MAG: hypothetical protein MUC38_02435 [Cyclobacteriaceae bacterium]|jgi:hypothetical protein|nr:hypothetical protein [Cyclobacteriaceae bacterium]